MSSLYALGSNGSGQLGIGHEQDVNTPTKVNWQDGSPLRHRNIKNISAGGNHTLILLDDGQIYWSGDNHDGRCFHQPLNKTNVIQPVKLDEPFAECKVSLIACAWEASVAVLEDGRVISCGTGNRGELGLGHGIAKSSRIEILNAFLARGTTIVDLAASMNHVVAVLSNGEVFAWGAGRKGQLGPGAQDNWQPQKIADIPFAVRSAVVGTNFSCVFGNFAAAECLLLGADKFGIFPIGAEDVENAVNVVASWGSLHLLQRSGKVVSHGRNDHVQLSPSNLSSVIALAAGSEHAVGIIDSGEVVTWGWGEHGNCGPEVDTETFDSHGSNLSCPGKAIFEAIFVGAGCATTWICSRDESP